MFATASVDSGSVDSIDLDTTFDGPEDRIEALMMTSAARRGPVDPLSVEIAELHDLIQSGGDVQGKIESILDKHGNEDLVWSVLLPLYFRLRSE